MSMPRIRPATSSASCRRAGELDAAGLAATADEDLGLDHDPPGARRRGIARRRPAPRPPSGRRPTAGRAGPGRRAAISRRLPGSSRRLLGRTTRRGGGRVDGSARRVAAGHRARGTGAPEHVPPGGPPGAGRPAESAAYNAATRRSSPTATADRQTSPQGGPAAHGRPGESPPRHAGRPRRRVSRCDTCSTEAARECSRGHSTGSPASPSGRSSSSTSSTSGWSGANPEPLRRRPAALRQPGRPGGRDAPRRRAALPRPQRPADHRDGLLARHDRLPQAALVRDLGGLRRPSGIPGAYIILQPDLERSGGMMADRHPRRSRAPAGRRLRAGRLVPHAADRPGAVRARPRPLQHHPLRLRPGRPRRRSGSWTTAGGTSSGGPSTG